MLKCTSNLQMCYYIMCLQYMSIWIMTCHLFGTKPLLKSPWVPGVTFMFLYQFLRRHCQLHTLVYLKTSKQLFGFLSLLAGYMALTYRLPDLDFAWFLSWPWPWIFQARYGLCYISAKNVTTTKTKSKYMDWTLGLRFDQWDWPWPWPWFWIINVK